MLSRFLQEPLCERKKAKVSPGLDKVTPPERQGTSVVSNITSKLETHDTTTINVKAVPKPKVLVPETCADFTMATSQIQSHGGALQGRNKAKKSKLVDVQREDNQVRTLRSRSQETKLKRPNIVIPETVPYEISFDSDESDEELTINPGQLSMHHVLSGPPAHSSTPVSSEVERVLNHRGVPEEGILSPIEEAAAVAQDGIIETQSELSDHLSKNDNRNARKDIVVQTDGKEDRMRPARSSTDSLDHEESQSPVFNKVRKAPLRQESRNKNTESPSLFDEDDENHEDKEHHNKSIVKNLELEAFDPEDPISRGEIQRTVKPNSGVCNTKGLTKVLRVESPSVDTSVNSNPSPSVLTGKLNILKMSTKENTVAKQSGENPKSTMRSSEGSTSSQHSRLRPKPSSQEDNGSPTMTTRWSHNNQRRREMEETASPIQTRLKSVNKKLVQTTISASVFQPKKTSLGKMSDFNGGKLSSVQDVTGSDLEVLEQRDLEEAMKRSMEDMKRNSETGSHVDVGSHSVFDSNMSGPQYTSTPLGNRTNVMTTASNVDAEATFKKPSIPHKLPTTPKRKKFSSDTDSSSPRRSPRLKTRYREESDETIDPDVTCLPDLHTDTQIEGHKKKGSRSKRILRMNEMAVPSGLNGSIDPNVRLSEYDTETQNERRLMEISMHDPGDHLEPISFLEIDMDEMQSQEERLRKQKHSTSQTRNRSKRGQKSQIKPDATFEDTEDVYLSCTSVVFGGGPAKNQQATSAGSQRPVWSTGQVRPQVDDPEMEGSIIDLDQHDSCPDTFSTQAFKS